MRQCATSDVPVAPLDVCSDYARSARAIALCGDVVCFIAATSLAMSFPEMVWRLRSDLQNLCTTRQHTATTNRITEGVGTKVRRHTHTSSSAAGDRDHQSQSFTDLVNEQESQRDHRPNVLVPKVPRHHRFVSLSDTLITNQ